MKVKNLHGEDGAAGLHSGFLISPVYSGMIIVTFMPSFCLRNSLKIFLFFFFLKKSRKEKGRKRNNTLFLKSSSYLPHINISADI